MHRYGTSTGITGIIWPDESRLDYLVLDSALEWCRLRDSNTRPSHYEFKLLILNGFS